MGLCGCSNRTTSLVAGVLGIVQSAVGLGLNIFFAYCYYKKGHLLGENFAWHDLPGPVSAWRTLDRAIVEYFTVVRALTITACVFNAIWLLSSILLIYGLFSKKHAFLQQWVFVTGFAMLYDLLAIIIFLAGTADMTHVKEMDREAADYTTPKPTETSTESATESGYESQFTVNYTFYIMEVFALSKLGPICIIFNVVCCYYVERKVLEMWKSERSKKDVLAKPEPGDLRGSNGDGIYYNDNDIYEMQDVNQFYDKGPHSGPEYAKGRGQQNGDAINRHSPESEELSRDRKNTIEDEDFRALRRDNVTPQERERDYDPRNIPRENRYPSDGEDSHYRRQGAPNGVAPERQPVDPKFRNYPNKSDEEDPYFKGRVPQNIIRPPELVQDPRKRNHPREDESSRYRGKATPVGPRSRESVVDPRHENYTNEPRNRKGPGTNQPRPVSVLEPRNYPNDRKNTIDDEYARDRQNTPIPSRLPPIAVDRPNFPRDRDRLGEQVQNRVSTFQPKDQNRRSKLMEEIQNFGQQNLPKDDNRGQPRQPPGLLTQPKDPEHLRKPEVEREYSHSPKNPARRNQVFVPTPFIPKADYDAGDSDSDDERSAFDNPAFSHDLKPPGRPAYSPGQRRPVQEYPRGQTDPQPGPGRAGYSPAPMRPVQDYPRGQGQGDQQGYLAPPTTVAKLTAKVERENSSRFQQGNPYKVRRNNSNRSASSDRPRMNPREQKRSKHVLSPRRLSRHLSEDEEYLPPPLRDSRNYESDAVYDYREAPPRQRGHDGRNRF